MSSPPVVSESASRVITLLGSAVVSASVARVSNGAKDPGVVISFMSITLGRVVTGQEVHSRSEIMGQSHPGAHPRTPPRPGTRPEGCDTPLAADRPDEG